MKKRKAEQSVAAGPPAKQQQAHSSAAAAAAAAAKARLQQKLAKALAKAGGSMPAAAAAPTAKQLLQQQQQQGKQQHVQLSGIRPVKATPAELARRAERSQRFAADLANISKPAGGAAGANTDSRRFQPGARGRQQQQHGSGDEAIGSGWLALHGGFGTSTALEKEYLRLTAVPRAEDVRPPKVLRQSLAHVKQRWRDGCSYNWACSQLKSIRQDLTVQGVLDELARDAYETHARVALEAADAAEFRQCLARLKQLYRSGVPGARAEFYSYGVLHSALLGSSLLVQELAQLPRDLMQHPAIKHALAAVTAFRSGRYVSFIALYADAQAMAPYLMDALLPAVRAGGLATMLAAYHPCRLPLPWVAAQLGWGEDQEEELAEFLHARGVVVDWRAREVDTRATRQRQLAAAVAAAAGR